MVEEAVACIEAMGLRTVDAVMMMMREDIRI